MGNLATDPLAQLHLLQEGQLGGSTLWASQLKAAQPAGPTAVLPPTNSPNEDRQFWYFT